MPAEDNKMSKKAKRFVIRMVFFFIIFLALFLRLGNTGAVIAQSAEAKAIFVIGMAIAIGLMAWLIFKKEPADKD